MATVFIAPAGLVLRLLLLLLLLLLRLLLLLLLLVLGKDLDIVVVARLEQRVAHLGALLVAAPAIERDGTKILQLQCGQRRGRRRGKRRSWRHLAGTPNQKGLYFALLLISSV